MTIPLWLRSGETPDPRGRRLIASCLVLGCALGALGAAVAVLLIVRALEGVFGR